ncbi:MAG: hypothetical protein PHV18_12170 [Lachnospiraceae bacterium]|nr:hypothetical protein [Lachnospiraceae bacterium]
MDYYKISEGRVLQQADNIENHADEIRRIQEDVLTIHRGLRHKLEGMSNISVRLKRIEDDILAEAVQMSSLNSALSRIAAHYRNAENNVKDYGIDKSILQEGAELTANQNGEDTNTGLENFLAGIRSLLVSWGIIKAEKQERAEGEKVTEAQEKEMDRYMQDEIAKVLKEKRFSKKTWDNADAAEREKILKEYFQRIAGIMGLTIDPLEFDYQESEDGYYTMGGYSRRTKKITLNRWVLENIDNSYSLMKTISHELRHAYQNAAVENPDQFVVSDERLKTWEDNINNYKQQSGFMKEGMNDKDAYKAYRSQTIEKDARNFAKQ